MKAFTDLFIALDETTRTLRKVEALVAYFKGAPPADAIWAVSFLIGRKPRQVLPTRKLMEWAAGLSGIPPWLFDASYDVVGDLAETITLLLPAATTCSRRPLHVWVEQHLLPLRQRPAEEQRTEITAAWRRMDTAQRFVWNKLITGGFRVGVSQRLVIRALAEYSGLDATVIAHRLMGSWDATAKTFERILSPDVHDTDISRPYPFYLAYPLEGDARQLGPVDRWQVEWKWDGIRGQLVKRKGEVFIWSRGEELVTGKYPELAAAAALLPDGSVLDGEILPWKNGRPLPFAMLQKRIGRKKLTPQILEQVPMRLMAYDLLEENGRDLRQRPLELRRKRLQQVLSGLSDSRIVPSPLVEAKNWDALDSLHAKARSRRVEGFMLKRLDSAYGVGRRRGSWWKWKVDPLTADGVLIYAQRGHGRRSGLYTDYTFAVWDNQTLVPFAKAYSGLSDAEIRRVDRFVQRNTTERFGPVRAVKPELVFEIAFEGIQPSPRHKSGVAVRFPRIARWRTDKKIEEADSLATLKGLLADSASQ